jgi:AraC-like DNA-binding protein
MLACPVASLVRCSDIDSVGSQLVQEYANGREVFCDFALAGIGMGQQWSFDDGDSHLTVVDLRASRALHAQFQALDDLILVRACVLTGVNYERADGLSWRFMRPAVTVSVLPRGTRLNVLVEANVAQICVTLVVRASSVVDRYNLRRSDLPAALLGAIHGQHIAAATLLSLPLSQDVTSLVHDLIRSRLTGSLRGLQASARGTELFALVMNAWKAREAGADINGGPGRDAELVASASRILNQRLVEPPTLQKLALELGTNRNKLNKIFQRSMGVTVKIYCMQKRIERARALLQEGRLNISQIAETVGYRHQSSFTAAFRDLVGMSPRDYGNTRQACEALERAAR